MFNNNKSLQSASTSENREPTDFKNRETEVSSENTVPLVPVVKIRNTTAIYQASNIGLSTDMGSIADDSVGNGSNNEFNKDHENIQGEVARAIAYKLFMRVCPSEFFGKKLRETCEIADFRTAKIDRIVQKVDDISKLAEITHLSESQKKMAEDIVDKVETKAQKTRSRDSEHIFWLVADVMRDIAFQKKMYIGNFIEKEYHERFHSNEYLGGGGPMYFLAKQVGSSFHSELSRDVQGNFDLLFLSAMHRAMREFFEQNSELQGKFLYMIDGKVKNTACKTSFQQMLLKKVFRNIDSIVNTVANNIVESMKVNKKSGRSKKTDDSIRDKAENSVHELIRWRMFRKDFLWKVLTEKLLAAVCTENDGNVKGVSYDLRGIAEDSAAEVMSYIYPGKKDHNAASGADLDGIEESKNKITYEGLLEKVRSALEEIRQEKHEIELQIGLQKAGSQGKNLVLAATEANIRGAIEASTLWIQLFKFYFEKELPGRVLDAYHKALEKLCCVNSSKSGYDQAVFEAESAYDVLKKELNGWDSSIKAYLEEQDTQRHVGSSSFYTNNYSDESDEAISSPSREQFTMLRGGALDSSELPQGPKITYNVRPSDRLQAATSAPLQLESQEETQKYLTVYV